MEKKGACKALIVTLRCRNAQSMHQVVLRTEGSLAAADFLLCIDPVTVEMPGIGVVLEIRFQAFTDDALFEVLIQYWKRHFNPPKQIAVHPVRARQIDVMSQVVAEVIDARVFQVAADDRAHPDIFRQTDYTRPQRTGST